MATLSKLLALVALLLMPFAMSAESAVAAPHHAAAAPMEPCPDSDDAADTNGGVPECAMACSAALPAADLPQHQPLTFGCTPVAGQIAPFLRGIQPDIATPPPKSS